MDALSNSYLPRKREKLQQYNQFLLCHPNMIGKGLKFGGLVKLNTMSKVDITRQTIFNGTSEI